MSILFLCMSVHHGHAYARRGKKRVSGSLEPELQMGMNHDVGIGN